MTIIVGLTGGIGSGKSTVCEIFKSFEVPVISADVVAREVVVPGSQALKALKSYFGDPILTELGELNRAKLKTIIYQEPAAKKWVEDLLHPLIINEIINKIKKLDTKYAIIEIPLLYETGCEDWLDRVLVVDIPEDLQIKRAMGRDVETVESIEKIIRSQISREMRLNRADDIIDNQDSLEALKEKVKALHEKYISFAKKI